MRNNPLHALRWGMTLVELLVVITILGLLLAVSVPLLRPMLESRKTANAAQVLAGALQYARAYSIEKGESYGIRFIPYKTAKNVSLQLRLQKDDIIFNANPENIRAVVKNGKVILQRFYEGQWQNYNDLITQNPGDTDLSSNRDAILSWLQSGNQIQYNYLNSGLYFQLEANGTDIILAGEIKNNVAVDYSFLTLPDSASSNSLPGQAILFRTKSQPILSAWPPQTIMPQGTIVDIPHSGGEVLGFDGKEKKGTENEDKIIPAQFELGDEVVVVFSPRGNVNKVYVRHGNDTQLQSFPVNEMLYFCVGEWDRQLDADGKPMAEDGKSNLESPATYWVTLHPKTGEVRIAKNAPVAAADATEKITEARKFAKEYFVNVGGF